MHTEYLIIGQGIAGTLLSYELYKAGKDFMLIDDGNNRNASNMAAAIINPLAGKHWKPAPDAGVFMEQAVRTYRELETLLGISLISSRSLYYFPGDEAQQQHFTAQQKLFPQYLSLLPPSEMLQANFNIHYGLGEINGLWQVNAHSLLSQWTELLKHNGQLICEQFNQELLQVDKEGVRYKDIKARKIIFCEGTAGASNPWLKHIPFTANRGDVLLLSIPGLIQDSIYEHGLRLVPLADELFWCGSNYQWKYDNLEPDLEWRKQAEQQLEKWLKLPFTIAEHKVAKRPTTAGQKIYAGLHPGHASVAYLNGLGTRGFSAGPYWAKKLADILINENS